ncbi:MAG TPA: glycosyltransferase [Candidatus Acidoferrum sp.]|nr:glycosyltransferase [Candidatus Acidoferrum sp.]
MPPKQRYRHYWSPASKFAVAALVAGCWLGLSIWLSLPWLDQATKALGLAPALAAITFLAYLPGLLVAFLATSLLVDRQPPLPAEGNIPPVTVLIAARNEQAGIADTIRYLAAQDYEGPLVMVLVDNGSTDQTSIVARSTADELGIDLRILSELHPGKSYALNTGLAAVATDLVITLDADTLLHRSAIKMLVGRLDASPADVCAVAGCVLVRNSRNGFWARLQEWDYFLGIASVKRMQGLFQGTLVAQGAFSIYRTNDVRAVGGWPDAIGEDIVLTWHLMQGGDRVYFEPLAVAFTDVPIRFKVLAKQRMRWARGMIEALRAIPPWRQHRGLAKVLTAIDLFIPLLDGAYVFLFLPGIVLACFGVFWFVGPMTALVLPLTLLVYGLLFRHQRRHVFEPLGLRMRQNRTGFLLFLFVYQMFMSSFSIIGYAQELLGTRRRWK